MAEGDNDHPDPRNYGPNPPSPVGGERNFTKYGTDNAVYQPSWSLTEDGRGLLEGNVSIRYTGDPKVPKNINGQLPKRGDAHKWNPRLKCYKSQTQYGPNGSIVITAEYIGLLQDPTIPEVSTSGSTSSNNVQLHPAFPDLAMSQAPTAANPQYKFKPYVDTVNNNRKDFERFNCTTAPEGLRGADSYLAPRCNVQVTFYTSNIGVANKYLSSLGTISDKPQGGSGDVNNVPLASGGNYILTSCSVSQYGTIYKISAEWMQSEQAHKWTPLLYRAFGQGGRALSSGKKYTIGGDYTLGPINF